MNFGIDKNSPFPYFSFFIDLGTSQKTWYYGLYASSLVAARRCVIRTCVCSQK